VLGINSFKVTFKCLTPFLGSVFLVDEFQFIFLLVFEELVGVVVAEKEFVRLGPVGSLHRIYY